MTLPELDELTVAEVHAGYRSGAFTARELVSAYLDRIERLDRAEGGPRLNSVVSTSPVALEQADRLDAHLAATGELAGPLHGVPVAVKDQVETKDLPTTFGSSASGGYRPDHDATAVRLLTDAGAVVIAKTTLPDFATSWFSTSSRSGLTRNPYDLARDPGGSSSGTAAAVAANLALVGIGEDTGGSIRLPASFCGLVGVRPTPGLVSRAGMSSLVTPQDTAGPMTRTVADAARVLDVVVGHDPADPYTAAAAVEAGVEARGTQRPTFLASATTGTTAGVAGRRLGVLRQVFPEATGDADGAAAAAVLDAALARLGAAGAELVDVAVDDLDAQVGFTSLYTTRSQADMDAFVASRPGLGVPSMRHLVETGQYHPALDLLEAIVAGPADPADDPQYLQRVLAQAAFQRQVVAVMATERLDALVFPDARLPAPTHDDVLGGRWTCLTYPTNTVIASQLLFPAVTVPAGLTATGLPVGLEVVALPYADRPLVELAAGVEAVLQGRRAPEPGSR